MTPQTKSDSDEMQYNLTPAERFILKVANQRDNQPVCFLDFTDYYRHGTIRNAFSKLKKRGLIKLYCRSSCSFYLPASSKIQNTRKPVTITHMGGKRGKHDFKNIKLDLSSLLDSLEWEEVCRVHNINLNFSAKGLYDYYLTERKFPFNEVSKDIQLLKTKWINDRTLKVILHCNGKVSVYLKCSKCPIEVTIEGLVSLASFLGEIRGQLIDSNTPDDIQTPRVEDWIVVQWHYGRDGKCEFSGPTLNVTFKTWCNNFARIYFKNINNRLRGRLEIIEDPKKPLPEIFEEKINLNTDSQKTKKGERLASA